MKQFFGQRLPLIIGIVLILSAFIASDMTADTWEKVAGPNLYINRIIFKGAQSDTLIVASDKYETDPEKDDFQYFGNGIMISTDNGATFKTQKLDSMIVFDLLFSTQKTDNWYAAVRLFTTNCLMLSTDAGSTWNISTLFCEGAYVNYRIAQRDDAETTYHIARVSTSRGISKSADNFITCDPYADISAEMLDVKVSKADNTIFYAADGKYNSGIYYSKDNGNSYTVSETGLEGRSVKCVLPKPDKASMILCGTDNGIYVSQDGGVNWNALPYNTGSVYELAVHPSDPMFLAAATEKGVWISGNGGYGWEIASGGLPAGTVKTVAIPNWSKQTGYRVYAGVQKSGLYKSYPLFTDVETESLAGLSTDKIYPSPCSDYFTVVWNNPSACTARYTVKDCLGNTVSRSEEFVLQGSVNFTCKDLQSLSPGVYFAEIATPSGMLTEKIVKMK